MYILKYTELSLAPELFDLFIHYLSVIEIEH